MTRSTTFKYTVTVVNPGSGNKYYLDGILISHITLFPGCTYEFNQDDSSNATHPLRFSETSDGTHNSGSEYTTGVTTSGTPGSATAFTKIEVTTSTPQVLYYYCTQHSGMGNMVQVPDNYSSGDRAFTMGRYQGDSPYVNNDITYTQMSSNANFLDFGDLTYAQYAAATYCTGIFAGSAGGSPDGGNTSIKTMNRFVTKTLGNAADFGDLTTDTYYTTSHSTSTRGFKFGGTDQPSPGNTNVIEFWIAASTGGGNDFGDLTTTSTQPSACGSSTRAVNAIGSPGPSNVIDYITLTSTGGGTDFGDLSVARAGLGSASSSTRGLWCGGATPSKSDVIDYVTIASTGNATDFGNLTTARSTVSAYSNQTRCFIAGGATAAAPGPAGTNSVEYVTIASTGNGTDWNDLVIGQRYGNYTASENGGGIS